MVATSRIDRTSQASWLVTGAVTGVIAGVVFAMFEMIMASIQGNDFFAPLRMIGAIVLGRDALDASYSLASAIVAGLVVHMMLSAIYGAVFAAVAGAVDALRTSRAALIVTATLFGFALWIVNFYGVTAVAFDWFKMADSTVQFFAHTFFFGTVLGLLLASRTTKEPAR